MQPIALPWASRETRKVKFYLCGICLGGRRFGKIWGSVDHSACLPLSLIPRSQWVMGEWVSPTQRWLSMSSKDIFIFNIHSMTIIILYYLCYIPEDIYLDTVILPRGMGLHLENLASSALPGNDFPYLKKKKRNKKWLLIWETQGQCEVHVCLGWRWNHSKWIRNTGLTPLICQNGHSSLRELWDVGDFSLPPFRELFHRISSVVEILSLAICFCKTTSRFFIEVNSLRMLSHWIIRNKLWSFSTCRILWFIFVSVTKCHKNAV